jgi:hypothetical protein
LKLQKFDSQLKCGVEYLGPLAINSSERKHNITKHYNKQNIFCRQLYTTKSQTILYETRKEVKMKLSNKTHIVLGIGMSLLLLGIIILLFAATVKAVSNEDPSNTLLQNTEGFLTATAIRIPAPTNCPSGQVPTYTDPKGDSVSCGGSEGNTASVSIPFLVIALVGGIVLEALRATV